MTSAIPTVIYLAIKLRLEKNPTHAARADTADEALTTRRVETIVSGIQRFSARSLFLPGWTSCGRYMIVAVFFNFHFRIQFTI